MIERVDVARERVRVSPSPGAHAPGDADLRGGSSSRRASIRMTPRHTPPLPTSATSRRCIAAPAPPHAVRVVHPSPRAVS